MDGPTRVTLFVPGAVEGAYEPPDVGEAEVEIDWIANDGGFGAAFGFSLVDDDVVAAVDRCAGAAVVFLSVDLRDGRAVALAVVERLRAAGGLAVRLEESGLGWEIGQWSSGFGDDDPFAWHHHAVVYVGDRGSLQSCGMHAFSMPDVRIVSTDPEARDLAELLNRYQLAEDPVLRSGETFAPDADSPRRVLERWPDTAYEQGHGFHNPYGVWRIGPAGGTARSLGETDLVFIPALRLLLSATEQQQGGPLTEADVERVRDSGACIAMEPRHAQAMDRSRGYADLDPELAWEQWQALRP